MARPREFDEAEVLDRALEVFWEKGYDGSSIEDIVHATGLGRASLYGAFGDKERIYRRVLDHYLARLARGVADVRPDMTAAEQLRALFRGWVGATCPAQGPRGCFLLLAGTAGGDAPALKETLDASLARTRELLVPILRRGQAEGDVSRRSSAEDLAELLVVFLQGIAVSARAGWSREKLDRVVDEAIASLGP